MKCSICGKEIVGWSNNPWPIRAEEESRCCDECNTSFVVPARMCSISLPEDNKDMLYNALQSSSYEELKKLFIG